MNRFELVIFDLDGVLVDTSSCHDLAYKDTWAMIGIDGPEYQQIAGRKTHDVVSAYTEHLRPSHRQVLEWVRFKQLQARRYLSTADILYGDTISCLEALRARQIGMALGTSASRDSAFAVVERLGLSSFFSVMVTGDDVRVGKPAPDIFMRAMALAGVPPTGALVIEDSHAGLEAALASGAFAASVRTMAAVLHPQFVGCFPDLTEVLELMGVPFP